MTVSTYNNLGAGDREVCHRAILTREDPAVWHAEHLVRLGYYPKWRAFQRMPYERMDPELLIRQAKEMGATVFEWAIPENNVYIGWDGVKPHPSQNLYPGDLLADACAAARRHGVKLLVCVPTNGGQESMHEWFAADAATLEKAGMPPSEWQQMCYSICPTYPRFRRWLAGYVQALAKRYDIDGFIFDGPWYRHQHVWPRNPDGSSACELCRNAYRQYSGRDVPLVLDWGSAECRDYIHYFKNVAYAGYLKWLTSIVKAIDPRLFVTYNSPVYVWGGWSDTCSWDQAHDITDSFFMEMHLASREELQPILQTKLNRAALNGRAPELYCKTFDLTVANFPHSEPPLCEVEALGYLTLSEGAIIGIHSSMGEDARGHAARTRVFTEFGRRLQPKLPYFRDARPVEHAGVHLSERTRDLYNGENPSQYLVSPVGAMQLLSETQTTFGILLDGKLPDVTVLRQYPLLILANTAHMSEADADAVRQYVHGGGGLLATGETSLYDETDRLRSEFLLSDVLGVKIAGVSGRVEQIRQTPGFTRWPFALRQHAISEGLQDQMITRSPWYDVKADPDRQVLATWSSLRPDTDFHCVNGGLEITGDSGVPAIVAGTYGRGRVVYCAADLTGQYMFEMNRHIRMLWRNMTSWLSPQPVTVECPKHVYFSVTRQRKNKRHILHLVNILYNNKSANEVLGHGFPYNPQAQLKRLGIAPPCRSTRHEVGAEVADVIEHYRTKHHRQEAKRTCAVNDGLYAFDDVIPLHDVRIHIDSSRLAFGRAIDIETGRELPLVEKDNLRTIVLPRLEVYQGIALEA